MQPEDPIEEQALTWLIRSTSGDFGAEQRKELEAWLAQSESHRRAFEEAEALWIGLGKLHDTPLISAHREDSTDATDQTRNGQGISHGATRNAPMHPLRRFSIAAAASVTGLVFLIWSAIQPARVWTADYRTATGAQETLRLADGSVIYLNSASALNTDYDPGERRIELIQGEAEFVVAKDPARPFVVAAGGIEIRALGTDFIVRDDDSKIRVSVIESAVRVGQPDTTETTPVILHAGEGLVLSPGQQPGPVTPIDAERVLAWRNRELIFESESLDRVVAEINRYRLGHVFLSDSALAEYRVSGVFRIDRIDRVLSVIDQTLPVHAFSLGERYVVLYSR